MTDFNTENSKNKYVNDVIWVPTKWDKSILNESAAVFLSSPFLI